MREKERERERERERKRERERERKKERERERERTGLREQVSVRETGILAYIKKKGKMNESGE